MQPPAYSGFATPDEALSAHLQFYWPDADPKDLPLTGRNASMARFENDRAIFLAEFLQDGQWYVVSGNTCWDVPWGASLRP